MKESGYYPPGAEFDPQAPWNEKETEPVVRDIEYSCIMRRTSDVETTDYIPGTVESEWDGDGYVTFRNSDDFSNTDWLSEWKDQNRTPKQLIKLLHDIATAATNGRMPKMSISEWRDIAADCEDWEMDDEDTDIL